MHGHEVHHPWRALAGRAWAASGEDGAEVAQGLVVGGEGGGLVFGERGRLGGCSGLTRGGSHEPKTVGAGRSHGQSEDRDGNVAGPAIQDASESDLSKEELLERVLRFVPSEIKLRRPELRPGVVPRPKLAAQLQDSDATVALVVAPPGYGKTTLVSEMTSAAERPFAWLTITDEDNDPSALLAYVALALDSVEPLDRRTFSALAMSQADLASIRLPRLGNVLADRSLPFLLVLSL